MTETIEIRKLPPVWFIRTLNFVRSGMLRLYRMSFPANIVMYEQFTSFWILSAIRVAAELNIAGILEKGPMSIQQLATSTGSDPNALFRMMRALSSEKIFKKTKDDQYINTRLSKVLTERKGSLRYTLMQHLGTLNWTVINDLSYSIKTGQSAFSKVYGMKIYDYLSQNPDESLLFDRSMTNLSEIAIEPILSAFNFSNYPVIADIGGGEGLLLSSILYKNINSSGILYDLPEGLINAESMLKKYGVNDRVQVIHGSFFDSIPSGADIYLLKNIIHNWNTEDSTKILKNIRKVMPPHGRILIFEMILDERNRSSFGKLIDLQMMIFMEEGKERTRDEFESLLRLAGLKIKRIIPTIAPINIIEAVIA